MTGKTTIILSAVLVAVSFIMFLLHYMIFHDIHHIMLYTIHDLAFLPLEVLIVSLVLHRIIDSIQKKHMLGKMNMAIGMFFSECGTNLLKLIVQMDKDSREISSELLIRNNWTKTDYRKALTAVEKLEGGLAINGDSLGILHEALHSRRDFILRLLENPNLLEHEDFTDLLWAVFHLTEELSARGRFEALPANDIKHLDIDIMRAYKLLVREWLKYMENLKNDYPYLFSMAVRTNPLDKNASPLFS